MNREAVYYTTEELGKRGLEALPDELLSSKHLIYSSPAALAFNSPGAEGFGVKRAGLAIPGSVMLLVAPGCCGRNTSLISSLPEYNNRFFYLMMDETDIVTGRHLKKIPKAVEEVCNSLSEKPSVVMICITCVDALLGTDMERVCRKAEEAVQLPVRPCYMYALTREGRKPPMVHVRQSLYSLLEPTKKRSNVVNLLGFFAPLIDDCELYDLLHRAGVKTIHEISRCKDYTEYLTMSEANFNLVLNPEARYAATDFEKRLGIPSIELKRLYQIDKIENQYRALGQVLGITFDDAGYKNEAIEAIRKVQEQYGSLTFAVGECMNGDPFELSLALIRYGFQVSEIYGTISAENYIYVKKLGELSPKTRVYSNLEPTMLYYDCSEISADITIGKDAGYYHTGGANLNWNQDIQPFGYRGLTYLFQSIYEVLEAGSSATYAARSIQNPAPSFQIQRSISAGNRKGLRKYLTPFAPDQSGAVSVLYELGGILVICDAGGCVGNICGFDEPRWTDHASAIFSAGLRDMDAIMGRDDRLVEKLTLAAEKIDAEFAAVIGTPVPAVIATDYHALKRMAERKTDLPILTVDTNGMDLYDRGAQKAYEELFRLYAKEICPVEKGRIGVIGVNPLDMSDLKIGEKIKHQLEAEGWIQVDCYGMGAGLERIRTASAAEKNLVTAPSGLQTAIYLEKKFGTPYDVRYPLAQQETENWISQGVSFKGKKILVLHQQVIANSIREELEKLGAEKVDTATWFMKKEILARKEDLRLIEEEQLEQIIETGGYDIIIGDADNWRIGGDMEQKKNILFLELAQFAVSGHMK